MDNYNEQLLTLHNIGLQKIKASMERECKKWKSELAENEAPKKLADFIEPATEEELKLDIRKSVLDAVRVHRAKKKYAAYKRRLNRRKPK